MGETPHFNLAVEQGGVLHLKVAYQTLAYPRHGDASQASVQFYADMGTDGFVAVTRQYPMNSADYPTLESIDDPRKDVFSLTFKGTVPLTPVSERFPIRAVVRGANEEILQASSAMLVDLDRGGY
jgi:hypothetical protein